MSTPATGMTVEQFHELDFGDAHAELVGGVVVVSQPKFIHGWAQAQLQAAMVTWVNAAPNRGAAVGTIGVELTEHDSYGPDALWIAEQGVPADPTESLPGPPDLVVEIRSPGTWRYDVGRKREIYEAAGVAELWLVDPYDEVVTACRRSIPHGPTFDLEFVLGREDTLRSPLLPGFELPLERIFFRR